MRLLSLTFLMILLGPRLYGQQTNQSAAAWHSYINTQYGYELRYPKGFELWPTGPEGKRDGASIRVGIKDYAAPAPILDIQIYPKTPKEKFPRLPMELKDLNVAVHEIQLNGRLAIEATYNWKSTGELAFSEIFLDGVVFHFDASSGTQNFHETEWWQIISSFVTLNSLANYNDAFFCEGCTGEGIPILISSGLPFSVRKFPDESSKVIESRTLATGTKITLEPQQSIVITRNPGLVLVLKAVTLKGYLLGNDSFITWDKGYDLELRSYALKEGDTFKQFQYAGEGGCYIKIQNDVLLVENCTWLLADSEPADYKVERIPETEWWLKVENGWTRLDGTEKAFEISGREW